MEHLAQKLVTIPGVVGVALGGSRAAGTARPDSDWDFGLYYREWIDPTHVRALGFDGEVFEPGEWGRVPNGGAWLVVDGVRVDLIYRDLATVEQWTANAVAGRFQVFREVGYVAGVSTYSYAAELAVNRVLIGEVPRSLPFPDALQATAPAYWSRIADGALKFADAHARRDDAIACAGNLSVAALATAHRRLCERGEWYVNEKGLLARAGLDSLEPEARALGVDLLGAVERIRVQLT